ncbi:MAG: TonB-dependent receptor [Prevotellaceae bacterium]|jgi:TonB-linked SusC/RagA family outer membrane protein|nr:TonB-dependent receptor [Prevotellaceae bacterium]
MQKKIRILLTMCITWLFSAGIAFAQSVTVSGTVADANGDALSGVSVIVKGTTNGVITGLSGEYSLSVSDVSATLVFSHVGYASAEESVGNRRTIRVVLQEDTRLIEEVVVLGYGVQARKADLSASIGTVKNMDVVKSRPVSGATDLLQGQIPGVTVTAQGGDPTQSAVISIRGQGSRRPQGSGTNPESPLWVVDGVPGAPMNLNDIESIVVLKDAASAAIYGAYSGSAGVIMVTTKRAKAGKPSVSYEGNYGLTHPVNMPQSLTIEEEKAVRRKALEAAGATLPDGWDETKNPYIAQTRTDWIDAISRTALFQRHNVSVNAGTENFSNRLSLQYNNREGILISTYSRDLSLRYDASFKISRHVRLREDFFWNNSNSRGTDTESGYSGVILSALMMPRNAEVRYADGTYGGTAPKDPNYSAQYGSNFADIHGDVINPVRSLEAATRYSRPTSISSSTFLEILEPIPGLRFTSRFTYKLENYFYKNFNPKRPEPGKPMLNSSLEYESSRYNRWETENTLNYDRSFGYHKLDVLLSSSANAQRKKRFLVRAQGFESEEEIYQYLNYAETVTNPEDFYDVPDNNVSLVGRVSYSWNNRYFATASYRRDYAGRLPKNKKYGDFPALTAAWKISEEGFFPKSDALSLLKVRASWGRIGNLSTLDYAYGNPVLDMFNSNDVGGQVGINTPLVSIMVHNRRAFNPYLTWETSEQTDFGLDVELLKGRLSFSADYFAKRTYNLIKDQDSGWPAYIGLEAKKVNEGEIRNRGFEFSAGWNDRTGEVGYFVSANLSALKNRVHDIGATDPVTGTKPVWIEDDNFRETLRPFRTREGDPLYTYWLVETDGLFRSDAEAAAYVDKQGNRIQPNAKAGDLKFVDRNGDGKINDDDRVHKGSYMPDLTYAFTGGVSWKNLSFSVMLQGISGAKAFNAWKFIALNESQGNFNRWNRILDAYPTTNDIPRLSATDANNNFTTNSDWYLEDASYLRIKNVNIAYSLDELIRKASPALRERKSSLSVNLSIDNLYTFTRYSGMDPEVGGKGLDGGRYPVPRIFSFGIKLTY